MTAPAAADSLRIGCVKYLNARPLIHGWPGPVAFDHPAVLCERLAAGELDIALVSSFEFLRNPHYAIVDDIAIASDGAVHSVIVASPDDWQNIRAIELDPASLTSVHLLQCLLNEHEMAVELRPRSSGSTDEISAGEGRLLIGDQAIRFRQARGSEYRIYDLGQLWREATALPFVYALWLVHPRRASARLAEQLRDLRDANVQQLTQLAAAEKHFAPDFCEFYWRDCLRFHFADREKAGLLKFRSLCEKHGILPPNLAPLTLI